MSVASLIVYVLCMVSKVALALYRFGKWVSIGIFQLCSKVCRRDAHRESLTNGQLVGTVMRDFYGSEDTSYAVLSSTTSCNSLCVNLELLLAHIQRILEWSIAEEKAHYSLQVETEDRRSL